jgi:GNAT superfamily N-acetyltransferase
VADPGERLTAHLRRQLGAWPPRGLHIATSPARTEPGWDGIVRSFSGVRTPEGTVLSVEPSLLDQARALTAGCATLGEARPLLEPLLGGPLGEAAFRWCEEPADLEPAGEWRPVEDPALPDWLRPFGGDALVVTDDGGAYLAGVGLKRHDDDGWEIAVGTDERARGRGLARRLVATAARHVLDQGKVPLYLHAVDNTPSARVADASGFPDRGWRLVFVHAPTGD